MCTNYDRYIKDKTIKGKMKKINFNIEHDEKYTGEDFDNLKQTDIRITSDILTVIQGSDNPVFTIMNWSINWNPRMPIYNSRIETIRDQKRWTSIFEKSRCLIPATRFFEYRPFENDPPETTELKKQRKIKRKTKFGITIPGEEFFFIGGIYVLNNGKNYCSMITTPPHKDLLKIPHNRSPYLLEYTEAMEFLLSDAGFLLDNITGYDSRKKLDVEQVSEV